MDTENWEVPALIQVNETVRLRRYDGVCDFALAWYRDPDTVYLVDGKTAPYDMEKLKCMYAYLNEHGALFFIEVLEQGAFLPIGDVTFSQEDMPIVIGDPRYRGRGIGSAVIGRLAEQGRALGYDALSVHEIYRYNTASQKAFERAGFARYEETAAGYRYRLELTK